MTSPPPPSPHPLGAEAPKQDYVGLAAGAMGLGITVGTAAIAVTTWTVRTLQTHLPAGSETDLGLPGTVLLGGTLMALAATWGVVWLALSPVRSPYRQGGLAMATVFATFLVAIIGTFVADNWFGRGALLVLAGLAVVGAWGAGRKVGRERQALAAGERGGG